MSSRQFHRIIAYFAVTLVSSASAEAADIVLRAEADSQGSVVVLADIADVQCEDIGEQARLAGLPLFPAPAPGTRRWLRVRELQELLTLRNENMTALHLKGASRVTIRGTEDTKDASQEEIPAAKPRDTLHLVARRDLLRGDVLRAADLELVSVDPSKRTARNPVTSLEEAVGQQLLRAVPSGQPLDYGYLRQPIWVERGRAVTVTVRTGGIRVATAGKALQEGARDDLVSVELNDGKRKRVVGRVVGIDEIEVAPQGIVVAGAPTAISAPNTPGAARNK